MSPKRKIPSRKLTSKKLTSQKLTSKKLTSKKLTSKKLTSKKPTKPLSPAEVDQAPKIPECFWQMGFEEMPTLEELRQRYKELSLVLHPDARGSKQAFLELRTNYEAAQAILNDRNS